jgi:SAM-dependent methyltransferase
MRFGSTEEWRRIARGPDVLYHVLGWPGKEGRWTEEEFYATGVSDWEDFERHWLHFEPSLGGTCVEIGCGVGRLSAPLAGTFDRVVALDVSGEMIERARRNAPGNVEFARVDGPLIPLAEDEADAVFSVHVLQHLESPDALSAYLRETARVLRPGGTAMLHIWLSSASPSRLGRLRRELALRRSRRALRRGEKPSTVRMLTPRLEDAYALLAGAELEQIELRMFPVRSNGFHHHFWFARAGANAGAPTVER